ncbi:sugar kinase [bacterium]|nr:sugar kinase [bacterium]
MSILVVGTVALDTVSTPFGKIDEGLGGSAMHFAVSSSYYTPVSIVAIVGQDFPQKHLDFLKSRNINIDGIHRHEGKTFRWTGKYDYDLNNAQTLKTELNVLLEFSPKLTDAQKKNDFLFLANVDPDIQRQVIEQMPRPKLIACDTMNFWIEGKKDSLLKTFKMVDMVTINEGEARLLSGEANLMKAAKAIIKMGPKTVVIKQGEYGALLFHDNHVFSAPGLPLETVMDPTGAGDSFAGGLMGYLSRAGEVNLKNLKQGLIAGSVMASLNVEAFSCERIKNLSEADLKNRYAEFRALSHFEDLSF